MFNFKKYQFYRLLCKKLKKKQPIDASSSTLSKMDFSTKSLTNFLIQLSNDFLVIKAKAIRILLDFHTSFLCGTGFSVASLKSKYRNKLQLEKEHRVAISNVESKFQRFCETKLAHVIH